MLQGVGLNLYQDLLMKFNGIKLIASGGVNSIEEVKLLMTMNMESIIVGKALYEGVIEMEALFSLNTNV